MLGEVSYLCPSFHWPLMLGFCEATRQAKTQMLLQFCTMKMSSRTRPFSKSALCKVSKEAKFEYLYCPGFHWPTLFSEWKSTRQAKNPNFSCNYVPESSYL